ncbi:MAG: sugar phosphate isomerase/epimerase [Clostridia bacterium]|nr:sugar phosphate isomerase/epimerase [Clostridia bacterium]
MKIGVLMTLEEAKNRIALATEMGIHSCQLCSWDLTKHTDEMAEEILGLLDKYDMEVSTFWAGWSGPQAWNFTEGPLTLGLLPTAYRYRRVQELKAASDFAKKLGIKQVATHAGFIPENPHDPQYAGMLDALREVAEHMKKNGQYLLFETGQETPVTLLRAIGDIGTGNLGVNLDTANLILYGKGNPVDALDVFGQYVMDLHIKDGLFPTDGWKLGHEVAMGEGKADFPRIIEKLKALGYDGALTIEREISGEKQIEDILKAKALLEQYI